MNVPFLSCCLALALLGCQTDSAKREDASVKRAPEASAGKPQAPVRIDAQLDASSARVTVRFDQAGSAVSVRATGADGLSVQDGALALAREVASGETASFDVPFTPGPGQSMLVISVRGNFGAGERTAVRAFPVGKPSAEQLQKADAGTAEMGNERVKLMPAEEVKK